MAHLNNMGCFNVWLERRNKVCATLSVADASLKSRTTCTSSHSLLSDLIEYIERNLSGIEPGERESYKPLAIPLSEFRRILMGRFDNYA